MTASGRAPVVGDVAVRLREGELRAGVRVELGVAAVGVGGERDAEAGGLVDADHAGVVGLRERGVALHEAVVLVGDPRLGGEVRASQQARAPCARSSSPVGRAGERRGRRVGLQPVLPRRARVRAVVDRAVVRDGARVDVDDPLAVVVDGQAAGAVDLADDGGLDVPLAGDREELVELVRA